MTPAQKPILLIVEDHTELREWLSVVIASHFPFFQIRTAASAIEFHRAIDRDRPAFVLLDEVLGPGEDLASLLRVVKERGVPTVLMTGMDPGHERTHHFPDFIMRRINKPHWGSGSGVENFLSELSKVIARVNVLTTSG